MKNIITLILITCSSYCFSQKINIEISNPNPRVGEWVELKINLDFLDSILTNKLSNNITERRTNFPRYYQKNININNTGLQIIAPFEFQINNKTYKSDSIIFYAIDSLPQKVGTLIRTTEFNNIQYIIIEQSMEFDVDIEKEINLAPKFPKEEFTSLLPEPMDNLEFVPGFPYNRINYLTNKKCLVSSHICYKIINSTNKEIPLERSFFVKLQDNIEIPILIIK